MRRRRRAIDLTPKAITAALVGLTSHISTFQVQRFVNDFRQEPLMAILPGVALAELWGLIAVGEQALLLVSGFVVVAGLFGLLTALLTSLNERRREMSILRSVGARPAHVFSLSLGGMCADPTRGSCRPESALRGLAGGSAGDSVRDGGLRRCRNPLGA